MDTDERDIMTVKIATARKEEYEAHLIEAPTERRVSVGADEEELERI